MLSKCAVIEHKNNHNKVMLQVRNKSRLICSESLIQTMCFQSNHLSTLYQGIKMFALVCVKGAAMCKFIWFEHTTQLLIAHLKTTTVDQSDSQARPAIKTITKIQ